MRKHSAHTERRKMENKIQEYVLPVQGLQQTKALAQGRVSDALLLPPYVKPC